MQQPIIATAAVIVAGGKGRRFGAPLPKQYAAVHGHPVLAWTVSACIAANEITEIILVAPVEDAHYINRNILARYPFHKSVSLVSGGDRRQDSVRSGLEALGGGIDFVAIHDGVRPAVTPDKIDAVCRAAYATGAALLAVQATDSIFTAGDGMIERYIERGTLWRAQTPQVFNLNAIKDAHARAHSDAFHASDDGMIYRKYVGPVAVVEGSVDNIKITYQRDLLVFAEILKQKETIGL